MTDLHRYLRTYFPNSTGRSPFSDDHKMVIAAIQSCILGGGWFLNSVYRGFAKTTITERAAIWALSYGHRRFVALFSASKDMAAESVFSIQTEIAENDLLLEDFPEMCLPARALEGRVQRCKSQTYQGKLTHIEWSQLMVALAQIPGAACSGGIVWGGGLAGGGRGMHRTLSSGEVQRPDLGLVDDPQTDEGAASERVTDKLENRLKKNIAKLGGHERRIALVVNATPIEEGDLVFRLADSTRSPGWTVAQVPMMKQEAELHELFWMTEYKQCLLGFDPSVPGDSDRARKRACALYRKNRKRADKGCRVSWRHCYAKDDAEISAIQHAYNERILLGEAAFATECQVTVYHDVSEVEVCTAADVLKKLNGYNRGVVPKDGHHLTAFIDAHQDILYFVVAAWGVDFSGYVLDYGGFPDQGRRYWGHRNVSRTLGKRYGAKVGMEGAVAAGLSELCDQLLKRVFPREDGAEMRIGRLLIDAGWETETVKAFVRRYGSPIVHPSQGVYVGAKKRPFSAYREADNCLRGHFWRMPPTKGRAVRQVFLDANAWKSFVHRRMATAFGDASGLSLYGRPDRDAELHRMFADHFAAEKVTRVRADTDYGERTVDEFECPPGKDNHLLDCIVGAATAAQMQGVLLPAWREKGEKSKAKGKRRKRVSYI